MPKKKKDNNPLDPTKPLPNRKHEHFAKTIASNPLLKQDEVYLKTYPDSDSDSAIASASRLLNNVNVRARVMALLDKVDAGLPRATQKLKQHLESDTESISLDATKTVFKLAGAMDEVKGDGAQVYNPVQVIIKQMNISAPQAQPSPQVIDIQQVTDSE